MVSIEEKILVKKAVSGDVGAFEKLISFHENKIFSFALSISGGNRAVAEDIYQDALIKAFMNIKKFNGRSSFSTWLWRIIRNGYYDFMKAENKWSGVNIDDLEGFEPSVVDPSELELIKDDRSAMIRKLISKLSPDYMEVITLIDLQEMEHDEAAELIGVDKGVLKVRLHRARTKLISMIEENIIFFD